MTREQRTYAVATLAAAALIIGTLAGVVAALSGWKKNPVISQAQPFMPALAVPNTTVEPPTVAERQPARSTQAAGTEKAAPPPDRTVRRPASRSAVTAPKAAPKPPDRPRSCRNLPARAGTTELQCRLYAKTKLVLPASALKDYPRAWKCIAILEGFTTASDSASLCDTSWAMTPFDPTYWKDYTDPQRREQCFGAGYGLWRQQQLREPTAATAADRAAYRKACAVYGYFPGIG